MLKSAVIFFRKLRVSYVVLVVLAIAQQVKEFNLILFYTSIHIYWRVLRYINRYTLYSRKSRQPCKRKEEKGGEINGRKNIRHYYKRNIG